MESRPSPYTPEWPGLLVPNPAAIAPQPVDGLTPASTLDQVVQVLGFVVGGLVLQFATASTALLLDAGTFVERRSWAMGQSVHLQLFAVDEAAEPGAGPGLAVARAHPDVALIVTGHSHTYLKEGRRAEGAGAPVRTCAPDAMHGLRPASSS